MKKIIIKVEVEGVKLSGDVYEIIEILHVMYGVPSPVIYQFLGEIGVFTINKQSTSFKRPYGDTDKMYFMGSCDKE